MTLALDDRTFEANASGVPAAAHGEHPNPRTMALLAGWSYVALFGLAVFANFMVRERLVDTADAATTFTNLADNQGLVRAAIVAFIVVFALDVVVAWALYHLFRPAGAALSALSAWFRIVYTVFLGVAVVFLYLVLRLVGTTTDGTAAHITALGDTIREANTMLALEAFNVTWLVGLVAFGVHLILLGALILRSPITSRALGIVLTVAGAAYIFDTAAYTLVAGYADNAAVFTAIVAGPAVIAEAAFTLWLLLRAGSGAWPPKPEAGSPADRGV